MSKSFTTTKELFTKLVTILEKESDDFYGEHNKLQLVVVIQCLNHAAAFYRHLDKPLINDILVEDRIRIQLTRLLNRQQQLTKDSYDKSRLFYIRVLRGCDDLFLDRGFICLKKK